jgi:hypothetical protein
MREILTILFQKFVEMQREIINLGGVCKSLIIRGIFK